jgi:hypothetical protein
VFSATRTILSFFGYKTLGTINSGQKVPIPWTWFDLYFYFVDVFFQSSKNSNGKIVILLFWIVNFEFLSFFIR